MDALTSATALAAGYSCWTTLSNSSILAKAFCFDSGTAGTSGSSLKYDSMSSPFNEQASSSVSPLIIEQRVSPIATDTLPP